MKGRAYISGSLRYNIEDGRCFSCSFFGGPFGEFHGMRQYLETFYSIIPKVNCRR